MIKVLFVSSGRLGKISPLIENQGRSLISQGVGIEYFLLKTGFLGYFLSIFKLRKYLKANKFDIVHAHYSLSAFIATFSGARPLVVSLLGSDAFKGALFSMVTRFFNKNVWTTTIVKTKEMQERLCLSHCFIIPNGVDIERFYPMSKNLARERIGFESGKKLVVFVADPNRQEKNFKLANEVIKLSSQKMGEPIELLAVFNMSNEMIPYYINAADVLLLTSKREGSVNVIKEAMACNKPIVSTRVGDVEKNLEGVWGCFVCDQNPQELSLALVEALGIEESDGRPRIIALGLSSEIAAKEIIKIYEKALSSE